MSKPEHITSLKGKPEEGSCREVEQMGLAGVESGGCEVYGVGQKNPNAGQILYHREVRRTDVDHPNFDDLKKENATGGIEEFFHLHILPP